MGQEAKGQEVKVYVLKYPVKVGARVCKELRFCRPKMKDFIAVGASPLETAEAVAKLVSSITGEPLLIIEQLDIEDAAYVKIESQRIYNSFFITTPYELNPTPPPQKAAEAQATETTEAETEAPSASALKKSEAA